MNKEIKEKWIAALRSGEYTQAKEVLKNESGFCCLGVLCDLYSKEKNIPWKPGGIGLSIEDCYFSLPAKVIEWAGFKNKKPIPIVTLPDGRFEGLSELNDTFNFSFNQIADLIEQQGDNL
jgi:hypothetical protein